VSVLLHEVYALPHEVYGLPHEVSGVPHQVYALPHEVSGAHLAAKGKRLTNAGLGLNFFHSRGGRSKERRPLAANGGTRILDKDSEVRTDCGS
jgi:hypothetical protein